MNLLNLATMTELELFAWIKWSYFPDLERSTDQYSSFDCVTKQGKMYIELKCRKTHYDNLLIEKVKFDRLSQKAWEFGYIACYINSTPEGIWAFDLAKHKYIKWFTKDLPATTEFNNIDTIEKTVGYLNVNRGGKL